MMSKTEEYTALYNNPSRGREQPYEAFALNAKYQMRAAMEELKVREKGKQEG